MLIILGLSILLMLSFAAVFFKEPVKKQVNNSHPITAMQPGNDEGKDVFISAIPSNRFDELKLEDLPSTPEPGYFQSSANYQDHVFVASNHHILEYDAAGTLVRYSDRSVFDCPDSLTSVITLADDTLYAACWNVGIYEINLKTNRITYLFDQTNGLTNTQNIEPIVNGNIVWAGTFNGVAKIDRKTRAVNMYTDALNIHCRSRDGAGSQNVSLRVHNNDVWAISLCGTGVSQYQADSDSWKNYSPADFNQRDVSSINFDAFIVSDKETVAIHQDGGPDYETLSRFNRETKKWEYVSDTSYANMYKEYADYLSQATRTTPKIVSDRRYYALSGQRDHRYFLMSTAGLEEYSQKDSFPTLLGKATLSSTSGYRMIISESGRYIVGIGDTINDMGGEWIESEVIMYDRQLNKQTVHVIKGDSQSTPPAIGMLKDVSSYALIEQDDSLSLTENGKEVLKISLRE
jgi:hypothetical protein